MTALAAGFLMWAAGAAAKDYRLAPTTKWVMDYQDDSCVLARQFGDGDDKIIIQLIRYSPTEQFTFHVIGKPLGQSSNLPLVKLRFGSSGEFVRTRAMAGKAGKLPALFLSGRLDNLDTSKLDFDQPDVSEALAALQSPIDPAVEAAVETATIQSSGHTIVLDLGSMGRPMAAMRNCTTDLVTHWGLDPQAQSRLLNLPTPKSNPGGWARSGDYPIGNLRRGEQAIVRFRLMVDATGGVTGCSVQSNLGVREFGERTCILLKQRAAFYPARAQDGKAVPSYWVNSVRWVIP